LWASIVAALIGAAIAISMPKARMRENVEDSEYFSVLKRGVKAAIRMPALARAIAIISVAGCITDLVTEYSPLFATDRAISATGIAAVSAVMVLAMAAASAWASKLPGAKLPASVHLIFVGALIIAATFSSKWVAIGLFGLSAAVANATWILIRAEMQPHIDHDIRATTTSVAGFAQEVLNVLSLFAVGILADQFTRDIAFRAVGVMVVVAATLTVLGERPQLAD
jgi:hypothetical protein